MKKILSYLLILAVMLSLCACGTQTNDPSTDATTNPTTETTEAPTEGLDNGYAPEQLYGHIDQTKPNADGVYKIWSGDGVANMINAPEGTFELLCNIDMEGASLSPIGNEEVPFSGKIDGKNFVISNFTLASDGKELGFVGYNEGTVQDLQLENVTITTAGSNQFVGTIAGVNHGTVLRCKAAGKLTAAAGAEDMAVGSAIGYNRGSLTNSTITVDMEVSAAGTATVGGLVGTTTGGKLEYVESYGAITVSGEKKTVGLFAGVMENTPINTCAFIGTDNSLNGELFTNLTNAADMTLVTGCVMRDNTPVEMTMQEEKLRNTVVERMNALCSVEWKVRKTVEHDTGTWSKDTTYYGMPYRQVAGSYASMMYVIDEDGYLKDFVYDWDPMLLQSYMGTDCSTAVINALWTVSNSVDFGACARIYPWDESGGCLYVGDWVPDKSMSVSDSSLHVKANGEDKIYECYAKLKKGDFYVYNIVNVGGHTRMAVENAVVVRDQNGKIDPNYSYVSSSEQGWTTNDTANRIYTTCRVAHKYTFANLIYDNALPVTCEELVTGEMEPATCELLDAKTGIEALTSGTVKTNYCLDYVEMVITDSSGKEVFNHLMFVDVGKKNDSSMNKTRYYIDSFDLGRFAAPLAEVFFTPGQTYSYTVKATNVPGDTFTVQEGSFTYGAA